MFVLFLFVRVYGRKIFLRTDKRIEQRNRMIRKQQIKANKKKEKKWKKKQNKIETRDTRTSQKFTLRLWTLLQLQAYEIFESGTELTALLYNYIVDYFSMCFAFACNSYTCRCCSVMTFYFIFYFVRHISVRSIDSKYLKLRLFFCCCFAFNLPLVQMEIEREHRTRKKYISEQINK